MEQHGPMCVYDFTASCDKNSREEVLKLLSQHCKKWVFQKERGLTGYDHYQGRLSLKRKERLHTLVSKFPGFHLSITSSINRNNDFYVTKDETRIDGPWKDSDPKAPYIPRQCRVEKWRPWQQSLIDILNVWDSRKIHIIYDPIGNSGKSVFVTYLGASGAACQIPPVNDFKDLMRMTMDMPKLGCYLIDMPRAMNKEKLFQFYSAIETVKSGYAYDDRYSFKYEYFDSPNICVFSNTLPDTNLLSKDRWKFWGIDHSNYTLTSLQGETPSHSISPDLAKDESTTRGLF